MLDLLLGVVCLIASVWGLAALAVTTVHVVRERRHIAVRSGAGRPPSVRALEVAALEHRALPARSPIEWNHPRGCPGCRPLPFPPAA